MGKGSRRRPTQISRHEERLRWKLATGKMTFTEFEKAMKKIKLEKGND